MSKSKPVGFDQRIELRHLDYTATEAKHSTRDEMYRKLQDYLYPAIKGASPRKKAVTVLMKTWFLVDENHQRLQQKALQLHPRLQPPERTALHWGMILLAYPFFRDLVFELGAMFHIQDRLPGTQIHRKMKDLYGDKRRVEIATTAALSSMKVWGVLARENNNLYKPVPKQPVEDLELKRWLVEVLVRASGCSAVPLPMLVSSPLLFPFKISINPVELDRETFSLHRQGVDVQVISLGRG